MPFLSQESFFVLRKPCSLNLQERDLGENCELCAYCFRGHKVIAVTLLQHGADTTIKNNSGKKSDEKSLMKNLAGCLMT